MFEFNYYFPTRICFAEGCLSNIGKEVKRVGDKPLAVTGERSAADSGLMDQIGQLLRSEGFDLQICSGVTTNPGQDQVLRPLERLRSHGSNVILTVGGGSVHDVGKLVSLMATHTGNLSDYTVDSKGGIDKIKDIVLPVICVPTIAGTGSEVSPAALVKIKNQKKIIYSPYLFPKTSIVDTSIMFSKSPELNSQVAFDSFVQGLEAFVAANAHPFSDMFALAAITNCIEYLPLLARDVTSRTARAFVALAALQSMFAVSQSGVGAIHALSDPLSAHCDIHHGKALAMLAPHVIRANMESNLQKYVQVVRLFGYTSIDLNNPTEKLIECVTDFIAQIGLSQLPRLSQLNVSREEIEVFVEDAHNPDMSTNPKQLSNDEIKQVFLSIY